MSEWLCLFVYFQTMRRTMEHWESIPEQNLLEDFKDLEVGSLMPYFYKAESLYFSSNVFPSKSIVS